MARKLYRVLMGTVVHGTLKNPKSTAASDDDPTVSLDEEEGKKLIDRGVVEEVKTKKDEEKVEDNGGDRGAGVTGTT